MRPNSATPTPPGTGTKLASSETLMLITSSSASERSYPKPRAKRPSAIANSSSVPTLPNTSRPSLFEARNAPSADLTSGHQRRVCSTISLRTRGTSARNAADATTTATRIQSSVVTPPEGQGRSSATVDSEKTTSTPSRSAWIAVPTNESIAPEATAIGAESPCRWKKRMLTAIRARFDGSATFMYPIASCIVYTGPKGSETGTEPSVVSACVSRGSCATTKASASQPHAASATDDRTSCQSTPLAASTIV